MQFNFKYNFIGEHIDFSEILGTLVLSIWTLQNILDNCKTDFSPFSIRGHRQFDDNT